MNLNLESGKHCPFVCCTCCLGSIQISCMNLTKGSFSTPSRYRQVPTFGRDTIHKFRASISELKKMATRDFEDLLQVNYSNIFEPRLMSRDSAPYECLMASCLIIVMPLYWSYCPLAWPSKTPFALRWHSGYHGWCDCGTRGTVPWVSWQNMP